MDDSTKILIALGASAAANCRPCMDHHAARARDADLAQGDVRIALELGVKVGQGALTKTRDYIRGITEGAGSAAQTENSSCC